MVTYRVICGIFILLFWTFSATDDASALQRRFAEDFSTKTYCNEPGTTALWDTVSGELKLPPFEISPIGNFNTAGSAYGVALAGEYAFVADWANGLVVLDISDTAAPSLAATCATPGSAFGLAVAGDRAYVADKTAGLQIIDISDPTAPLIVGNYDTAGEANSVLLSGNLAFVADGTGGLVIVDVSHSNSPTLVGSYNTTGTAYGLALHGNIAYVADSNSGVQIIDISDPALPVLVNSYDTAGYAWDVTVAGDVLYVSDNSGGIITLNIVKPGKLGLLGSCATPAPALGIQVFGDDLYVACQAAGLLVVDIQDPAAPTIRKSYNTSGSAYQAVLAGEEAFVADAASGLQVLRVRDIVVNGDLRNTMGMAGYCYDLALAGDIAWVPDEGFGLRAIDISDPLDCVAIGGCALPGQPRYIAVSGDYAFVGNSMTDLMVIDISTPASPAFVDSLGLPGPVYDLALHGTNLYVAIDDYGVAVVDVSDPENIGSAIAYDPSAYVKCLAVDGEMLLVGTDEGFTILDLADPDSPSVVGSYYDVEGFIDLEPTGDTLIATRGDNVAYIYDISTPASPTLTRLFHTQIVDVHISGDLAYTASYNAMAIYDISDLSNLVRVGWADGEPGESMAVAGNYLYGAGNSGMRIYWVASDSYEVENNRAYTPYVFEHDDIIAAMRISTEQTYPENILWNTYEAGSSSYFYSYGDGQMHHLDPESERGENLEWGARIIYDPEMGETCPTATLLELEWLFDFAHIDSIADVPDDQGGWVRIHFAPSGWDLAESPDKVLGYNILRRIDDPTLAARIAREAEPMATPVPGEKQYFAPNEAQALSLPPGTWEVLGYVGAWQAEQYTYLAPTLADSSAASTPSVFCLMAQTATGQFFVSPADSGMSVDNIAPGVPAGLAVAYAADGNELSWDSAPEADFQYFAIYRGESEDFAIDPSHLVHSTAATIWSDPDFGGWDVFYKVSAIDHAGNESEAATPGRVSAVGSATLPRTVALHQNVPNPFNPSTTIRFDLPGPAHVRLTVYNLKGELVAVLVDRPLDAGHQQVPWTARGDAGEPLASGVYFYRLVTGDTVQTRKMILLM